MSEEMRKVRTSIAILSILTSEVRQQIVDMQVHRIILQWNWRR